MSNSQVSNYYIATPAMILSCLVCALSCLMSLYLIPISNANLKLELEESENLAFQHILRPKTFTQIGKDMYIYVENVTKEGSLLDVMIIDDHASIPSIVLAKDAVICKNDELSDVGPYILVHEGFKQSKINNKSYQVSFDEAKIPLNLFYHKIQVTSGSIKDKTLTEMIVSYFSSIINTQALISEISARIIWPTYTILFNMMVSLLFLKHQFSRRSSMKQVFKMSAWLVIGYAIYFIEEMYISKMVIAPAIFCIQFIVGWYIYNRAIDKDDIIDS